MEDKQRNIVWRMPHKKLLVSCEELIPVPADEEVLVKLEYCGICGSDIRFYKYGAIGTRMAPDNFILGHECSGTVVAVGNKVKELCVGDCVALEPGVPCGSCEYCKKGLYNLCPEIHFMAAARPATDGALRQYITYPAQWCFKLPAGVSTLEGCMIEPLAVGMHAAERAAVTSDKSVLIIGAGTMGYMTLLACKAMDAGKVTVADIVESRLEKAVQSGADFTINTSDTAIELHLEKTNTDGYDIVFECSGNPQCFADTWKYVKPGGVIVNVANAGGDIHYRFDELSRKEADIRSVWRYRNLYPLAIHLVAIGKINLKQIEPKIFKFEESNLAYSYAASGKELPLKVVIQIKEP